MWDKAEVWFLDHGEIAGGGQRFGHRLVQELRWQGADVHAACPVDGPMTGWWNESGIEVSDLSLPSPSSLRPRSIARAVAHTRALLRRLGEDAIVIANHPRVHAYVYAAAHALEHPPAVVNVAHEQESARRPSARFVYRRWGALMVVGKNAADEYRRRLPGVSITQANNFLPAESFRRDGSHAESPTGGRTTALGALARMIPEKGIFELVEELSRPEVADSWDRLRLAGPAQDPEYVARVERLIDARGLADRIELVGDVSDVQAFLRGLDALVVPSTGTEGQPTVVLEGLAEGVPVLLRDHLWSTDYEGLAVVPYAQPSDLSDALLNLPPGPVPVAEIERRFGPDQALCALSDAIQVARARP